MLLFNPLKHERSYADPKTRQMMQKVIDYFEEKGLEKIKSDWHEKAWNHDFVDFLKENQVFATLMTPAGYGDGEACWDTWRNSTFAEIVGFYGITYWYTFQVSMLGLVPVWTGSNEALKRKTADLLKEGKVFAFGLSEKEHGADIYASEMSLSPLADGTYLGNGRKYYIGNGNEAAITSMFGKMADTGEYVFFATDSSHAAYECVKNTVNEPNYVAELALHDYPVTDAEIMERGPKAWDNMLNTINVCKFNLGFGSLGLATHAFYEALDHASNRQLYGGFVSDFPHVRQMFVDSYCRLAAMRLFADRAIDYMRSASADDRRYLLYNPLVKMKVTSQGEQVVRQLHEIIAAKGFEKEPFFEIANHEAGMLPKLEGTIHVNMALVVKFMKNFLFEQAQYPDIGKCVETADDTFLFDQGPTRGLGKVLFHDYRLAYEMFDTPNVELFKRQIGAFRSLLLKAGPNEDQASDIDYLLALGECFSLIAYGQLILENAPHFKVEPDLIEQIFDFMVRDMSAYALNIFSKTSSTEDQKSMAMEIIMAPVADQARFDSIWQHHVYALKGQYNTGL
ncbi:MAG: acyl-CoA dehydrogenase family protein [Lysobacterales bacterium]